MRKKDEKTNHRLENRSPIHWIYQASSFLLILITLSGNVTTPTKKYFDSRFTNTKTHVIVGTTRRVS
jgi:hypothetical protein